MDGVGVSWCGREVRAGKIDGEIERERERERETAREGSPRHLKGGMSVELFEDRLFPNQMLTLERNFERRT